MDIQHKIQATEEDYYKRGAINRNSYQETKFAYARQLSELNEKISAMESEKKGLKVKKT